MRGGWLLYIAAVSPCTGCSPQAAVADNGLPTPPAAPTAERPDPAGSARPASSDSSAGVAGESSAHVVLVDGRPLRVKSVETGTTLTNCCEGEQIRLSTVDPQGNAVEVIVSLLRMDPARRPAGPIDLAHLPDRFIVTVSCRPHGSCRCGDHGSINTHNSELRGSLTWTTDPQTPRLQASLRLSTHPRDAAGPAPVEIVTRPVVIHTACIHGMHQTCNHNPEISSLRGRCRDNGTCECQPMATKVEQSGRCR